MAKKKDTESGLAGVVAMPGGFQEASEPEKQPSGQFVAMCEHQGALYVASTDTVYRLEWGKTGLISLAPIAKLPA